jgi:hypothetical protein
MALWPQTTTIMKMLYQGLAGKELVQKGVQLIIVPTWQPPYLAPK